MQDLKYIKSFLFDVAKYNLSDGVDDSVELQVNYKENTFKIFSKGKVENEKFRKEIEEVVKDMLIRKHGVNFANKK